jgi:hypothetical protein
MSETAELQIQENAWGQVALNTETPPTAAEVIAFLQRYPSDSRVYGYEGERGSEIILEKPTPPTATP